MVKLKVPNWLGGSQNISHDVNVRKKGGKNTEWTFSPGFKLRIFVVS